HTEASRRVGPTGPTRPRTQGAVSGAQHPVQRYQGTPTPGAPSGLATLPAVAMDIVPIQLSLTAGDLITLWAPRWREAGEEWEGFLGDEDAIHAFPDAPALA